MAATDHREGIAGGRSWRLISCTLPWVAHAGADRCGARTSTSDITLPELKEKLAAHGAHVSVAALWRFGRFCRRHKITRKKRWRMPRSRIVPDILTRRGACVFPIGQADLDPDRLCLHRRDFQSLASSLGTAGASIEARFRRYTYDKGVTYPDLKPRRRVNHLFLIAISPGRHLSSPDSTTAIR